MKKCSLCGIPICGTCVMETPEKVSRHMLKCSVVALLETQQERNIKEAIGLLQDYYDPSGPMVEVIFDACEDDIENGGPGIAKANGKHIIVCDRSRMAHFQDDASKEVPDYQYDYNVSHLTVVVLHEFGHVLDRRKKLPESVSSVSDDKEGKANAFVRYFLE